ncbi:hypothetical protein LEP1GSC117_2564 [Leptospira interrogans serovar Icterohaemorrhagiae str. Verdun LP]|nr:hypothetical protein LEP1GSC117_2564 [Leptospira interrogans serovar Icterohaemorrhagiae str. Verdun LP]EMO17429.1 hypothetical protein LEP1GSC167_0480 [Leptospira interrogans serovar Copenhageni str. HAI0188]
MVNHQGDYRFRNFNLRRLAYLVRSPDRNRNKENQTEYLTTVYSIFHFVN